MTLLLGSRSKRVADLEAEVATLRSMLAASNCDSCPLLRWVENLMASDPNWSNT